MIERNDPCFCGSGKKWKKCHFPKKPEESLASRYRSTWGILLKTDEEIAGIRRACEVTAEILDLVCQAAKEGVTTNQLDELARTLHRERNARPAPLGYGFPPYPKSICTSLNEVICHGIPDDVPLQKGDILNIDVSSWVGSYVGDASRMVMIGDVSEEKKRVVETSLACLEAGITVCQRGALLSDIGRAITKVAHENSCSVVHQFVGHGVGVKFHEPPDIPHHINTLNIPLEVGMTFTIEPMINAGVAEAVIDETNGWIARTRDGRASAQWEHTILITDQGPEVLTRRL
jgi:methionyl aminopeptidase